MGPAHRPCELRPPGTPRFRRDRGVRAPDGRTVATGGADQTAKLWDTATGQLLAKLTGHTGAVVAVAYLPDGHSLVSAGEDGTVRFWDAATGREQDGRFEQNGPLRALAMASDGHTMATLGRDGTVLLWRTGRAQTGRHHWRSDQPDGGAGICPRWPNSGHEQPRREAAALGRGNGAATGRVVGSRTRE